MKKRFKSRFRIELGEAALEIILSLVFLGIGAMVLALFGVSGDAEWLDSDLVMLIGIVAVFLVGSAIGVIVWTVKKKNKRKNNAEDNGDDNKTKGD